MIRHRRHLLLVLVLLPMLLRLPLPLPLVLVLELLTVIGVMSCLHRWVLHR